MKRMLPVLLAVFVVTVFFIYVSQAQMPEKRAKNTMTLPNGDVIWDLNGEWDAWVENYGSWSQYGSYPSVRKITQKGTSFEVIRMTSDAWNPVGSIAFKGELHKNGSVKGTAPTNLGPVDMKGQITDNGNKMVIDDGERTKTIFTRK